MITQNQQVVAKPQPEKQAIPIGREILAWLKSALSKQARSIDKLPSDRELVDAVVSQTMEAMGTYVYYSGKEDDLTYLWFDSEIARSIQANPDIRDKRRFVEACIGCYLGGPIWMQRYCVPSRLIRPRNFTQEQRESIAKTAAAIADAKSVDSSFQPGSDQSGGPA